MSEKVNKAVLIDASAVGDKIEGTLKSRPDKIVMPLRKMLVDLDIGLPEATSGEALSSRVKW